MNDGQHLKELSIRGFRGLSSLDLDGLGSFNILLGANDVGKTSILEAIFLLSGAANPRLPMVIQNWRNYQIHDFDGLSPLFHNLDVDQQATVTTHSCDRTARTLALAATYKGAALEPETQSVRSNGDDIRLQGSDRGGDQTSSVGLSGPRVLQYDVKVERETGEASLAFTGKLNGSTGEVELDTDAEEAMAEMIPARFVTAGYGYESGVIASVIVNKKTDELLEYLRVINPRAEDVAINGSVAYLDIGLKTMMPLNMFGSGMMRAAAILSLCILGSERILLVDELENGLHYQAIPPLLKALLKLSSERQVQIVATTHRLEVLKGLHQVLSQDLPDSQPMTKCFTLQRDKQGLVRSYKYEYDQFEHCMANGIELR